MIQVNFFWFLKCFNDLRIARGRLTSSKMATARNAHQSAFPSFFFPSSWFFGSSKFKNVPPTQLLFFQHFGRPSKRPCGDRTLFTFLRYLLYRLQQHTLCRCASFSLAGRICTSQLFLSDQLDRIALTGQMRSLPSFERTHLNNLSWNFRIERFEGLFTPK